MAAHRSSHQPSTDQHARYDQVDGVEQRSAPDRQGEHDVDVELGAAAARVELLVAT